MNGNGGRLKLYFHAPLLISQAEAPAATVDAGGLFFAGIIVLLIGLLSMIYPRFFWNIGIGRKAKIPPPTLYLIMLRIGGVLACAVAAAMLLNAYRL